MAKKSITTTASVGAPVQWENVEECAERLSMSVYNIQRLAKLGLLPAYKVPGGRRWLFDPTEVDAAMKNIRSRWFDPTAEQAVA